MMLAFIRRLLGVRTSAQAADSLRAERAETRREAAIAYLRCHGIYRGDVACDHVYRPCGADWLWHKQRAMRRAQPSGESRVLELLRGGA